MPELTDDVGAASGPKVRSSDLLERAIRALSEAQRAVKEALEIETRSASHRMVLRNASRSIGDAQEDVKSAL